MWFCSVQLVLSSSLSDILDVISASLKINLELCLHLIFWDFLERDDRRFSMTLLNLRNSVTATLVELASGSLSFLARAELLPRSAVLFHFQNYAKFFLKLIITEILQYCSRFCRTFPYFCSIISKHSAELLLKLSELSPINLQIYIRDSAEYFWNFCRQSSEELFKILCP